MKKSFLLGGFLLLLIPLTVIASPKLQVGAPGGLGEGSYADYLSNSTNPTEKDTAFTSGSTIYAAGIYGNKVVNLGGQASNGLDWGRVDSALSEFNTHGAVLLAAVPDGTLLEALNNLTIGGTSAFHSSGTLSGLFPNNHDPLKNDVSDFLFFDIGDFVDTGTVPDFYDETGLAAGEIKSLTLELGNADLDWIHFDLLALQTKKNGTTTVIKNPGSHDLTWKNDGGGGGGGSAVPEPATFMLFGFGLLGLAGAVRKKSRQQ